MTVIRNFSSNKKTQKQTAEAGKAQENSYGLSLLTRALTRYAKRWAKRLQKQLSLLKTVTMTS